MQSLMAINTTSFNLRQPDYLSTTPGPYRAQPSLFDPDFLKQDNPLRFSLDAPNDYFSYFALDNDFSRYASFNAPANQFDFSTGVAAAPKPDEQLREALKQGADYLTPEASQSLEPVAKALGFASAKNFVNALRHLPESSQQKVLQSLPQRAETAFVEARTGQLKNLLKEEAHHLLFDAFSQAGAQAPKLNPPLDNDPEGLWEAPQLLSIYNNVKSMAGRFSPEVLKDMLEPDSGAPLTFERRKTPASSGTNENILQALSTSMKVAEADGDNTIILYNSAFTTNPEDIVKSDDVQAYMTAYNQVKDSKDPSPQVTSLQQMLNHILPDNRKLALSGTMDLSTVATLAEFEGQQFLNQAADIIGDDHALPREEKQTLFGRIDQLKQTIFKEGYLDKNGNMTPQAQTLFDFVQNVKAQDSQLTPASKSRLTDLASVMEKRVFAKELNPELLERVVSNWFGMIDSGERKDFSEQVINHELGHFWEKKNNVIESWKNISFESFESGDFNHDEAFSATLKEGDTRKGYASRYAKLNPSEDFAESFRLFTRDPDTLIQQNLLKYVVMAGATGAHKDDYAGLIQFAEKNGYAQQDVAEAVKALRGRQAQSGVPDTTPLTTDQSLPTEALQGPSTFSPTAVTFAHDASGQMKAFTAPAPEAETLMQAQTPVQNTGHSATSKRYQFDLNVANYFPGIEENLNIQEQHVGDPSQPGFVLDNLAMHTENMEKWRVFSKSSRTSHRFVEDFKEKGIGAFSAEVQAKIPEGVKTKFENSDNRAIYLVMAKLRSEPTLAEDFMNTNQGQVPQDFFKAHFGDLLSGLEIPEALTDYLSHPENLVAATGGAGKSFLAAETLERNMADVIVNAQSNYKTAAQFLTRRGGQDLATLFTTGKYLNFEQDKGFSVNPQHYSKSMIYSALEDKLRSANFGRIVGSFSPDRLDDLSRRIAMRLDSLPAVESQNNKSWKKDTQLLEQINQIIAEELQANIPEVQKISAADITG